MTQTLINPTDSKSDSVTCQYCSKTCKNKMARWSHERFCPEGPAMKGKTKGSQVKETEATRPTREPKSDRIPLGARIMYNIVVRRKEKDGTEYVVDFTGGHTGKVVDSWKDGVTIEPMAPLGGEKPANRRIDYANIEGYWPKGAQDRSFAALRRQF